MVAVIANTNKDRPKMEWAGVDIGAKMFVGLENACPTTFRYLRRTRDSAPPYPKTRNGPESAPFGAFGLPECTQTEERQKEPLSGNTAHLLSLGRPLVSFGGHA